MSIEFIREDCPVCDGSDRGDDWDGTCDRCVLGTVERFVDVCDVCGVERDWCTGCGGDECACSSGCKCENGEPTA